MFDFFLCGVVSTHILIHNKTYLVKSIFYSLLTNFLIIFLKGYNPFLMSWPLHMVESWKRKVGQTGLLEK